jgi:hypothetical protein
VPLPDGTSALPGGISDVDAKKVLLGGTSLLFGLMICAAAPAVRILAAVGVKDLPGWDLFITALTISAGTEGANSVVKLIQYVKDAVKAKTPPSVAENSPVPQSPAGSAESGRLTPAPNNSRRINVDTQNSPPAPLRG